MKKRPILCIILVQLFIVGIIYLCRQSDDNKMGDNPNQSVSQTASGKGVELNTGNKSGSHVSSEAKTDEGIERTDTIPGDTVDAVGLREEFVYHGIGCTVKNVILVDARDNFTDRYPEFSDRSKWMRGLITEYDAAKFYTEVGMGDTQFSLQPEYRLIAQIHFHNYSASKTDSLFYKPNFQLFGVFQKDGVTRTEMLFEPVYNSNFQGDNTMGVVQFKIPARGDYEATFIIDVHPIRENPELDIYKLREFYGEGDLLIFNQTYANQYVKGDTSFPHILIKEQDIEKDIQTPYEKGEFIMKPTSYGDYYETRKGS